MSLKQELTAQPPLDLSVLWTVFGPKKSSIELILEFKNPLLWLLY